MNTPRTLDKFFGPNLLDRVRTRSSARHVTMLAGGTAIGQLVVVATAPVLTRIYAPTDFGALAVYVSVLTFLLGIASLRYQMAIPLIPRSEHPAALVVLCFTVLLGMVGLSTGIVVFFRASVAHWTNTPELARLLWFLPLALAAAGSVQIFTAWAVRMDYFGQLARVRVGQSVAQSASQLALGLVLIGPAGLLGGDLIGRATGGVTLSRLALVDLKDELKLTCSQDVLHVARRYRRFPLISTWTGLIASVGSHMPTLLIAAIYGATVVGWFGLSQRLLSMSFVLVASAIGTVFLSKSAVLARDNPQSLKRFFWSTVARSSIIALVLVAIVMTAAPLVFKPLFGSEWSDAGMYSAALAVGAGFQFVNRAVGSTTTVVERQDLDLIAETCWTLCSVLPLLLAWLLSTTPFAAMLMFSAGIAVGSTISIGISWLSIRQSKPMLHETRSHQRDKEMTA